MNSLFTYNVTVHKQAKIEGAWINLDETETLGWSVVETNMIDAGHKVQREIEANGYKGISLEYVRQRAV